MKKQNRMPDIRITLKDKVIIALDPLYAWLIKGLRYVVKGLTKGLVYVTKLNKK